MRTGRAAVVREAREEDASVTTCLYAGGRAVQTAAQVLAVPADAFLVQTCQQGLADCRIVEVLDDQGGANGFQLKLHQPRGRRTVPEHA
jgi:hypothetical protein